MTDDDSDDFIIYVRTQYKMLSGLEHMIERTDRLSMISALLVAIVAIVFATLDGYAIVGVALGAAAGGFFGHVWAYRRMRKRSFKQLTDSYQEIELQAIVREGEADD
jgi:O-antigen/teichoic acid export membrane protein